jgi:thiamine monophosphate kinase
VASHVAIHLHLEQVPLSSEATAFLARSPNPVESLLGLVTGGDDYQTLMCVAPDRAAAFVSELESIGVGVTQIGVCQEGQGLVLTYLGSAVALPARTGWQFSGA